MLSIYLSTAINWAIDSVAGHKGFKRTPYTHSVLGASTISIIVIMPVLFFIYSYSLKNILTKLITSLTLISIVIGYTHLLLDLFTVDGVYLFWPLSRKKISLLKVRYDNFIANTLITLVSITIIVGVLFNKLKIYVNSFVP